MSNKIVFPVILSAVMAIFGSAAQAASTPEESLQKCLNSKGMKAMTVWTPFDSEKPSIYERGPIEDRIYDMERELVSKGRFRNGFSGSGFTTSSLSYKDLPTTEKSNYDLINQCLREIKWPTPQFH